MLGIRGNCMIWNRKRGCRCSFIWPGNFYYWTAIFVVTFKVATSLRIVSQDVPHHVIIGHPVQMTCIYDLEEDELYSVKWYKDNDEFYRYLPKDKPPAQLFPTEGVHVDLKKSTDKLVIFETVDLHSTGVYKCEVSAEAPSFQTISVVKEMTVINLPVDGPRISGGKPKYNIGDFVSVNCTSAKSKPAAMLSWLVNGVKAPRGLLKTYPIRMDGDGLETSVLGLEFNVKDEHFQNGEMKLKCTAAISTMYHQSNEESVTGELTNGAQSRKAASVLESRETPNHGEVSNRASTNTINNYLVRTFNPCLIKLILVIQSFLLMLLTSTFSSV